MKTRIISGIVMGAIVACILAVGFLWNTAVITVALALLAAVAIYELLHNAAKIDSKYTLIGAMVYVFLHTMVTVSSGLALVLCVLYFIYAAIGALKNHSKFSLGDICISCFAPLFLSYGFMLLAYVIISKESFTLCAQSCIVCFAEIS